MKNQKREVRRMRDGPPRSSPYMIILLCFFGFLVFFLVYRIVSFQSEGVSPGVSFSSLPDPVAKSASRVYKLSIYDMCEGERFVTGGSAIVFGDRILTARHIFDYLQSHTEEGGSPHCFIQELISHDKTDTLYVPLRLPDTKLFKDIVHVSAGGALPRGKPECFSMEYAVGDSIYIVGYPVARNREPTVLKGKIASIYQKGFGRLIISRGDLVGGGMSGGAAINANGCIIGMLVSVDRVGRLNYSTPLSGVEDWIR